MSDLTNLQSLQSEFSDTFKDFHGYRPRFATDAEWNSESWLTEQIQNIYDQIEGMKSTFAGREELREQGWYIEETEPDLIKWAAWLKTERERFYEDRNIA